MSFRASVASRGGWPKVGAVPALGFISFGIDYHFTTAEGWLSQQLVTQHRLYGDDPINLYGDVYFPKVAKGFNVRFGRYISLPDIEAQLSPQNYMYSHSLLYNYDPFTQTGVIGTLKLNDRWLLNLGISAGMTLPLGL
jgi:hypothetical protein